MGKISERWLQAFRGDYVHRVVSSVLASEAMPVMFRMKIMRAIGFDLAKSCCIWAGASLRSKRVKIGANVFINVGFFFDGYDRLTIEDNVRIGQFVKILTATHEIGPASQRGLTEVLSMPVSIQHGSWIGCDVIILPGVTIAPGCVIAARSLVTKSTDANGLYAGNPARLVRLLA